MPSPEYPTEYGNAIIDNTLSLLATITTTDDLLQVWSQQDVTDTADPTHRGGFPEVKTGRGRTSGAGPVHRGDAPFAGHLTVSTNPTARCGPTRPSLEERVRALGRPPGSGDRRRGRPGR